MEYKPLEERGQVVDKDPYFTLMSDRDGVGFVQCGDGVLVVPLTGDEEVLMIVERSPAFDEDVLTLVGGEIEAGEQLENTANRELQEELGWRAEKLDFIAELRPFSKYLNSRQFVFLARQLTPSKLEGDETYPIRQRKVALSSFEMLCSSGELKDAVAISALYMVRSWLDGNLGQSD